MFMESLYLSQEFHLKGHEEVVLLVLLVLQASTQLPILDAHMHCTFMSWLRLKAQDHQAIMGCMQFLVAQL